MLYALYFGTLIILLIRYIRILITDFRTALIIGIVFTTFTLEALPWEVIPFKATVLQVTFILMVFFYHVLILKRINKRFFTNYYVNCLLVLWVLIIGYLFFSKSFDYGLSKTIFFTVKSLAPVIALSLFLPLGSKEIKAIFCSILAGSILASLNLFAFSDLVTGRAMIEGSSVLVTARTISYGVILLLIYFLFNEKKINLKSFINLCIILFCTYAILLTGSRAAIVAIIGSLLVILIFQKHMLAKIKSILVFFIISFAVILIMLLLPSDMFEIGGIQRVFSFSETNDNSDSRRLEKYIIAWNGIIESKGLGVGTGSFASLSHTNKTEDYPHNVFLEVALEQGWLGLSLLLIILFHSFIRTKRILKIHNGNPYIIALSSLWILGFVNALVAGDIGKNILWITLGVLWVLPDKKIKENTD